MRSVRWCMRKFFVNWQLLHKQKVVDDGDDSPGSRCVHREASRASPLRPLPEPLSHASSPWEDGGLWSLVSRKHSLAVHWMAPEIMAAHNRDGPGGRKRQPLKGPSLYQELATESGPSTYVLLFIVTTLCEAATCIPMSQQRNLRCGGVQ